MSAPIQRYVDAMRLRDEALVASGSTRLVIKVDGKSDLREFFATLVDLARAEGAASARAKWVKVVEGMKRDTSVVIQEYHGTQYEICVGCKVPTMYFQADGHFCEPFNAALTKVLTQLKEPTDG